MIRDRSEELHTFHARHFATEPENGRAFANGQANGHRSELTDEEVIRLARSARNAPKFETLWSGDVSGYPSHSEADQALVSLLAFYTQDEEQLERLCRRSGLCRQKWTNRPGYRRSTIEKALSNLTETYTPDDGARMVVGGNGHASSLSLRYIGNDSDDTAKVVLFSDLEEPKPREFLVEDVVPTKYATVVHGGGGSAKSILAMSLGMVVAGGVDEWLGLKVHGEGHVLFLDFELDTEEQHRRVRDLAAGLAMPVSEKLGYLSALGMSTREAFELALKFCKERSAVLLLLDSLGPAMLGDVETAKDVIRFHNEYIAPFRAAGVTVVIVDHQGKLQAGESYQQKSSFGSAYKEHLVRSVLQVEAQDRDRDAGTLAVRIRQKKSSFGPRRDPFDVKLTFGSNRIEAKVAELDDTELATEGTLNADDRVVHALKDASAYPDELAETTGLALGTVKNCLTRLKRVGKVEYTGELRGQTKQVQLVSSPSLLYRNSDSDDDSENESSPRLTAEEAERVERLVREGIAEHLARKQVLGKKGGHPPTCLCEGCLPA